MAESFSVRAILSATDASFSSTIKKASSAIDSIDKKISGFSFGILTGAGQAAFNALSSSVTGLIGEIDSSNKAWKTFEGNLKILGKSDKYINNSTKSLQKYAQQTVYSSSDMAQTFAQLEAVGVKNTASLVKGFGGLAAAAENPQQAMKSLSQQATQMAAKPKVAWEDFKIMLEQSPAGMAAVAKTMGMTTGQLVKKIQAGEVATNKFLAAIDKTGNSKGFASMATEAKSVGQAMDGLKETVGNKLMPAFEVVTQKGIGVIDTLAKKFDSIDAEGLATKVGTAFDNVVKYIGAFKEAFSGVGSEVGGAISAISSSLTGMTGEFGSAESVEGFKGAMESVAEVIKNVASFATEHASAIATLIKWLPAIAIGIKGFTIAKTVAPFVMFFAKGIASIAGKGIGAIAGKLFGISKAQSTVGKTSQVSGVQMMQSAKAFALMGVAVLLICGGFALLAASAIALANSGGAAIAVMGGMVVALIALGVGMTFMFKTLAPMSGQLVAVGLAFVALGAAVLLIAVGFALMAQASISLAAAGWPAIAVMVGMVAAIVLLAVGAATLGTALTAGAVGFLAFGAAVLLVGAGFALIGVAALLAAVALQMVVAVLPLLIQYGLQGAVSIAALGYSMLIFGVGAAAAGVALVVLAAGLALVGVAVLVVAAGVLMLAAGTIVLAAGLVLCGAAVRMLAVALPLAAVGATLLVVAFTLLLALAAVTAATLLVMTAGVAALGVAALGASVGVLAFGVAMLTGSVGTIAMAVALKGVASRMKTIAKNAKTTQKSLTSMRKSVNAVEQGLKALGSKAQSAMKKLTSAFSKTESKAKSSGNKVGQGFAKGMKTGLNTAKTYATSSMAVIVASLNMGAAGAYAAGAYISKGFARGMLSQLAVIRSAAAKMAAAADKAVRAKAKIKSPSRVAMQLGAYWGEGFTNGIVSMIKDAYSAAQELVSVPNVAVPAMAGYSGEMINDYDYIRNSDYTIEVPLSVDGKEFARATASYTQSQLDKQANRDRRKHGKV